MRDRRCCESYKLFDLVDKRHGKRMVQREKRAIYVCSSKSKVPGLDGTVLWASAKATGEKLNLKFVCPSVPCMNVYESPKAKMESIFLQENGTSLEFERVLPKVCAALEFVRSRSLSGGTRQSTILTNARRTIVRINHIIKFK